MGSNGRLIVLLREYWTPVSLSLLLLIIVVTVWATGDAVLARTVTDGLIRAVLVIGLYIFIGNSGVLAFGHAKPAFMNLNVADPLSQMVTVPSLRVLIAV